MRFYIFLILGIFFTLEIVQGQPRIEGIYVGEANPEKVFTANVKLLSPEQLTPQPETTYWLRVRLENPKPQDADFYLYAGNWSTYDVFRRKGGIWRPQSAGRFTPMPERPTSRPLRAVPLRLAVGEAEIVWVRLREAMNFYDHPTFTLRLIPEATARRDTESLLLYQGIFLGIILVMGLYNLFIFFIVRDRSFLYYVLSIFGIGAYFMFYYGFLLEHFWPNAPCWNAYSFALIVPFTRVSWIAFTRTYLNVPQTLPRWEPVLRGLVVLYLIPVVLGAVSWLGGYDLTDLTVSLIATLGIFVLSAMLVLGGLAWREGYRPARYFLIANIFFSIGSILFIFRETGLLPDTGLTRYASQVGVIVQAVLFSLGLANRLNETRRALATKTLEAERLAREKEREKKRLIESQNASLELEVAQRTTDLKEKTEELELAVSQLRDLNRLKDHLFSVISHDLRTPLTSLSSLLNLLTRFSDKLSEKEKQELTANTQQTLKNVLHLLENLLHWAGSQMNTLSFSPEPVRLAALSEEALALFMPQIRQKKLTAVVSVSPNLQIRADRQMLASVLRNLILNAIKFTASGGRIEIRARQEGNSIVIAVQDSGVGIPPDKIDKLFSPTEHLSTAGTQSEQGTGLGLMLCKSFVERHGGRLSVASQVGTGTTIRCHLPV